MMLEGLPSGLPAYAGCNGLNGIAVLQRSTDNDGDVVEQEIDSASGLAATTQECLEDTTVVRDPCRDMDAAITLKWPAGGVGHLNSPVRQALAGHGACPFATRGAPSP
jgi:hypothetical protein